MRTISFLVITLSILAANLKAQNPISPPGVYLADPSARVFKDGRLYVYGSLDESLDYYCSTNYHMLSTEDLKNWKLTENIFSSKGNSDKVDYSEEKLYAPDAIFKDGIYYLYYCLASGRNIEGVATAKAPEGPYSVGEPIKGARQIDPAIFIDDDGQAYYYWGQFVANGAKMKSNMKEIEPESVVKNLVSEKEHHFHEGSSMFKRNGIYYLVYTQINEKGLATSIGYSYSESPLGPFKYGGEIIDNDGCDPYTWNNHGSVQQFKGKWYVFYHRSTHGSNSMRKACIEPIEFTRDGLIPQVEMTSQGASEPLDPFKTIEAEWACLLRGMVRVEQLGQAKEGLANIQNDDKVTFKYFNFKKAPTKIHFKVKVLNAGKIFVSTNNFVLPINVYLEIPENKNPEFVEYTADVSGIKEGTFPVFIKFTGERGKDLFLVDSFWFE